MTSQWSNIFKEMKRKKKFNLILNPQKCFYKWQQIRHYQIYKGKNYQQRSCLTKMLKEGSFNQKEMISGRNMDIHEGMKNIRNNNYLSKYMTLYYFFLKEKWFLKQNNKICGVNYIYESKVTQGPRALNFTIVSFLFLFLFWLHPATLGS